MLYPTHICLVSHFGKDPGHTYSITSNLTSTSEIKIKKVQ